MGYWDLETLVLRQKENTYHLTRTNKHMYHLVDRSPWPLFMATSVFTLVSGLVWWMHRIELGGYYTLFGLIAIITCMMLWWRDVIRESTHQGFHTLVVSRGLKLGFKLFILSEVMFFFGFFWAYFASALAPTPWIGGVWPPLGYPIMDVWATPLLNTLILLVSGASITWAHRAVCFMDNNETFYAFLFTIFLGVFFLSLQIAEYNKASFSINDSVFGSAFYSLTGLHGFHVTVGLIFIIVCFLRFLKSHFTRKQHLGFVFAIWYWHFVDVVWLFLFIFVYVWGNGAY